LAGAIAASLLLRELFPSHAGLGGTLPVGPELRSFVLEIVLTAMLMFTALCVASGAKEKGVMAGAAVGAVVAFEALFAGPICGASMNPARSLAPALVSGVFTAQWIYVTAPLLGPRSRYSPGSSSPARAIMPRSSDYDSSRPAGALADVLDFSHSR